MGKRALYLVKQRQFIEHRRRAYGGVVASYGKWVTKLRAVSLVEAIQERARLARVGLQQTVVMFRGRVIVNHDGRSA